MASYFIEGFGYLASLLLALSLLVNNDLRFRWLNTGGCAAFIVYGVLLGAFPIILTNTLLLLINAYTLWKIYRRTEDFDLVPFEDGAPLLQKFLAFHAKDIANYFPSLTADSKENNLRFFVLRDLNIANAFVARVQPDGTALVQFNYTVPKYRDFKVGSYLFEKEKDFLLRQGIRTLVYENVHNQSHLHFLTVHGFRQETYQGKPAVVKQLG